MTEIQKKPKQKRQRSKAYPGATLEECVQQTIKIKRNLGSGRHDRESLAEAMGFSGVSGAVAPKIAALVYFGFLDKKSSEYWLSDTSSKITDPLDDTEKRAELRDALHRPTLYEDLLVKFKEDGRIPEKLEVHLHRHHGISDKAATKAADIFRESAVYAGVLNEEGKFVSEADGKTLTGEEDKEEENSFNQTLDAQGEPSDMSRKTPVKGPSMALEHTLEGYTVSIIGPKIQFSVTVSDETDLMIIEAMLKKVKTYVNEESI